MWYLLKLIVCCDVAHIDLGRRYLGEILDSVLKVNQINAVSLETTWFICLVVLFLMDAIFLLFFNFCWLWIFFFPQTFGELFLILSEMGFSEEQIQAAVAAGNFSVPDAADWWFLLTITICSFHSFCRNRTLVKHVSFYNNRLLQGQYPRHSLLKKSNQSAESAISAFNPPKEAASTSLTSPSEGRGAV